MCVCVLVDEISFLTFSITRTRRRIFFGRSDLMENEEIQLGVSAFLPEHSATGFLVPVLVRVVSNEPGEGKLSRVGIRENGKQDACQDS